MEHPCTNCEAGWMTNTTDHVDSCRNLCKAWTSYADFWVNKILYWKCSCGKTHKAKGNKNWVFKLKCPNSVA